MAGPYEVSPGATARRGERVARGFDRWLDGGLSAAARERDRRWRRSLDGVEAYLASVEPNRGRLRSILRLDDPPPAVEQPPRRAVVGALGPYDIEELSWPPWPGVEVDALIARPDEQRRPAVLAFHSLSASPEEFLGLGGPSATSRLTARLLEAGLAVIVPRLVSGWPARLRLARKARLIGREWLGLETLAIMRLLDHLAAVETIDTEAVGAYGFSRGGQLAMLLAALDERIAATGVASWFTNRTAKLVDTSDSRFTAFLESPEAEQFLDGFLLDFTDAELASLLVPDPLLITSGLDDPVVPFEQVEEAFERLRQWYLGLDLGELLELDLFAGQHEPAVTTTVRFFCRWLAPPLVVVPVGVAPVTTIEIEWLPPSPAAGRRWPRVTPSAQARRRRAGRMRRRRGR